MVPSMSVIIRSNCEILTAQDSMGTFRLRKVALVSSSVAVERVEERCLPAVVSRPRRLRQLYLRSARGALESARKSAGELPDITFCRT